MEEIFNWRENKSEGLAEAEPQMSLEQQRARQPLSSDITVTASARS